MCDPFILLRGRETKTVLASDPIPESVMGVGMECFGRALRQQRRARTERRQQATYSHQPFCRLFAVWNLRTRRTPCSPPFSWHGAPCSSGCRLATRTCTVFSAASTLCLGQCVSVGTTLLHGLDLVLCRTRYFGHWAQLRSVSEYAVPETI